MKNSIKKATVCLLAMIMIASSIQLPASASASGGNTEEGSIQEEVGGTTATEDNDGIGTLLPDNGDGITDISEILGSRLLTTELPDGTSVSLTAETDFAEGAMLEAYALRPISEIQDDLDSGIEINDSCSIEDIQSLLGDYLGLPDTDSLAINPAYDLRVEDSLGYISDIPGTVKTTIRFPSGDPGQAGAEEEQDKDEPSAFEATKNADLYHFTDDGSWESIDFDRDEDSREITFYTEGLSQFVFAKIVENYPEGEVTDGIIPDESVAGHSETDPANIDGSITDSPITGEPDNNEPVSDGSDSDKYVGEEYIHGSTGTEGGSVSGDPDENGITDDSRSQADEYNEETEKTGGKELKESPAEKEIETEETSEEVTGNAKDEKTMNLLETGPSDDSPLLKDGELMERTRALLNGGLRAEPGIQEPVTADGITIEKVTVKWLTKSTGSDTAAGYDKLELVPDDDDIPSHQWQIDFALSGKHEYEAGSIEIVIPAHIWLDRDGEEPGTLTLSVPEDPETGADYVWRRVGDSIVFTNTRNVSAATKVMIQGSYRYMKAHEIVDVDVNEDSGYAGAACRGQSEDLYATVSVQTPNTGETISMTSNSINATIDTHVEAASASKTAYNSTSRDYYLYWNTPENIPEEFLPANPDDYVYVRWFVSGQAQGNQPYTMTVTDSANGEYGCMVLGAQDANGQNIKSADGQSVTAGLFSGYNTQLKSAYIWTAYEKSQFTEPMHLYTVHNTQTITVTGVDDLVETTREASATVSLSVPIEYTVCKEWDDNDDEMGLRPEYQQVRIYRNRDGNNSRQLWKTVSLNEEGNWSYSWSDEGKAWHYETEEISLAHGSFETYYEEDGQYHKSGWSYRMKSKTYDPDSRTWTFVNSFEIQGDDGVLADMETMNKRVWWQYDDPYQRSTRDRALNDLLKGRDVIIPFDVSGTASDINAWLDNMEAGSLDKHRVNVVLEDSQHTNQSAETRDPVMINNSRVTTDDYELAYATIRMPELYGYANAVKDPTLPLDDPERYYEDRFILAKYQDALTDATFEGMINGEWVVLGELHGGTFTGMNGGTFSGNKLTFPGGVTRFRETVSSFGLLTKLNYTIAVKVHPSDYVLGEIGTAGALSDYMMMAVDNYARLYELDEGADGENVTAESPLGRDEGWELSDWDRGYLHGRIYRVAAYQAKSFTMTGNDTANRRLTLHTRATTIQQSNILTREEYIKAAGEEDIPYTEGGTWYDLLPPGVEPVIESITLQSGDKVLDAYTIDNYKGSGRTMLVVKAKLAGHLSYQSSSDYYNDPDYPREGYRQTQAIEFDAFYSWQDAKTFGLDGVRNTVAFQSDADWVGNIDGWSGETDDPRSGGNKLTEESVRSDLDIMTGLTSNANDPPSFLYAGATLLYETPDFMAETSLRKWVSVEGSGIWSYGHNNEAVVYEGGRYKYRIDLTGDSETETKDIILLDSLENYIPTADKVDDYGDHQWRGKLQSLDISGLEEAGIAPVVYYSTVPNIDISKSRYNPSDEKGRVIEMLENESAPGGGKAWSTTPPEDLSTVTAYAIDCRKKADGTDFTLQEGNTISVYVYMKAPQEGEADAIWRAGTGSRANPDPEERDETNPDDNAHAYNNAYLDSTQVDGIGRETHAYIHWDYVKVGIIPFNIHVEKDWDDMDDNDGKRPESVTVRLYANGEDTGEYLELDGSNGWEGEFPHVLRYDGNGNWITYSFVEEQEQQDIYEMSWSRNGEEAYILNTHEPERISVPVRKEWTGDNGNTENTRPGNVVVRLYADGVFTGKKISIMPDEDGNWEGSFTDLYRYKEGTEISYTVQEETVDDYVASYSEDGETQVITNTYHPYNDLVVRKTLVSATTSAETSDFTFTIVLTDPEGNPLTEQYEYGTTDGRTGKVKSGDSITLKGGQSATIKDIPTHTAYLVTEDAAKGFTCTAKTGDSGTILSYEAPVADFTNEYASKGSLSLSAEKILNGRALERYQFRFQVDQILSDGTDLGMVRMATNAADGSVSFGSIRFTEADDGIEKIYRIREVSQDKPGYTYDTGTIYAKVTPTDNGDGTMDCTEKYYDAEWNELSDTELIILADGYAVRKSAWDVMEVEDKAVLKAAHANIDTGSEDTTTETALPAAFLNDYSADGAIVLRAWKQLTGRILTDDEFEFELTDSEGTVLQTARNTADGSIVFSPIAYTESDAGRTYYYFVREKAGNDDTVIYDGSVYGYDVEVIDAGDGTLQFRQGHQTVSISEEDGDVTYAAAGKYDGVPVFSNSLKDGALTVSKYTTWHEGDTPDPDQEFRFRIRLINPDGTPLEDGSFEYDLEQIENIGELNADSGGTDNGNAEHGDSGSGTDGEQGNGGS